jgi:cytochrome c-type biogenesis protein CcmH/NrfG
LRRLFRQLSNDKETNVKQMKFRLIFSAIAIIVALGAYALKGGFANNSEPQQDAAPQATQQPQQQTPAPSQDNGMSGFSINNKN